MPAKKQKKALQAINRFPVFDLACAVGRNKVARESYLRSFLAYIPTNSYEPTRRAANLIYGVERALDPTPTVSWEVIHRQIVATCRRRNDEQKNLLAARCLFDFVRKHGYQGYDFHPVPLPAGGGHMVSIGIDQYVVDGERVAFQFLGLRGRAESDDVVRALCSMIHHAYVTGDFAIADVEVLDLSWVDPRSKARRPRIRSIASSDILSLSELSEQINEVHGLLQWLAERMDD